MQFAWYTYLICSTVLCVLVALQAHVVVPHLFLYLWKHKYVLAKSNIYKVFGMSRKHRHNLISTEFHRTLIRIFCIQLKVWLFQHCCYVNSVRNFAFIQKKIICTSNEGMFSQWRIQDFPEGSANSQSGCANLLFCNYFAENCMKMKEFGPRGITSLAPPWIRQWFLYIHNNEFYEMMEM